MRGMNDKTRIETINLVRQIEPDIDWSKSKNRQLLRSFLSLRNEDEAKRFLRDLMTEPEIKEFANRLEAAKLLTKDTQYNAISEDTGLSSATIARIAKWLGGSLGGYRLILSRLSNHHSPSRLRKGLSLNS